MSAKEITAVEMKRDPHRGGVSYEASMLRELLARIHRDGGHYVEAHGLDKALEDAEEIVIRWLARDNEDGPKKSRRQTSASGMNALDDMGHNVK